MSAHFSAKCASGLAFSQYCERCGLRSASFKKAPDGARGDRRDNPPFYRFVGDLALRPMRDRPPAVFRRFAGQPNDRADLLGRERWRGAGARRIRQPLSDARVGVLCPPPPPRLDRGATDAELVRRRPHTDILTRQQDNPRALGQLLRAGRLSLERLQLSTLAISDEDRGRTKQGHGKKPEQAAKMLYYNALFRNGIRISIMRY